MEEVKPLSIGISVDRSGYPRDPRHKKRGLTGPKDGKDRTPGTGKLLGISVDPSGHNGRLSLGWGSVSKLALFMFFWARAP